MTLMSIRERERQQLGAGITKSSCKWRKALLPIDYGPRDVVGYRILRVVKTIFDVESDDGSNKSSKMRRMKGGYATLDEVDLPRLHVDSENITVQFSFSIECENHFYGPTCTIYCNDNFNNLNGGSFKCSLDGKKLCKKGWKGTLCAEPQCDQKCVHGTCVKPNTCIILLLESSSIGVILDGEEKPAQNACRYWAANMVDAADHVSASASPVGAESSAISILRPVLVMVSSAKTAAPVSRIRRTPTDAAALRVSLEEAANCSLAFPLKSRMCALTPTPRCKFVKETFYFISRFSYSISLSHFQFDKLVGEFGTSSRNDFVLISLLLTILALSLAIITLIVKFVCVKLAVIQKTTIQKPFNCSTHWVTTEVHFRNGIRRNYKIANGGNYELDYGSGLSVTLDFVLFGLFSIMKL
ncbi:unnamed protein product [Angiostrongylus costaricensis]|uniref:Delta-like protein n=1 Tax=Angiostrongylus costaricensis TaxID=334426 RepID=A0A158PKA9_ANGCS|nr:unnamed protein product [Angiostrongylus costaricensis]